MKNGVIALIAFGLLCGSFVMGARWGAEAFVQSDAKYQASLITYRLQELDAAKTDSLRESLEFFRDLALLNHARGETNFLTLLWPDLNAGEQRKDGLKALRHAIEYKKLHPEQYVSEEVFNELDSNVKEDIRKDNELIERLMIKYSN